MVNLYVCGRVSIKIPTFKIPMIIIPTKWYFEHFFVGIFGRWYYEPCRRASVGILIAHWYFDRSLVFWLLICFEQMLALWFWKWVSKSVLFAWQQTIRSIKLVPNACFLDLCFPFFRADIYCLIMRKWKCTIEKL